MLMKCTLLKKNPATLKLKKGIVFVAIKEPEVSLASSSNENVISFAYPNDSVEDDGKYYFQDEVFDNAEDAFLVS